MSDRFPGRYCSERAAAIGHPIAATANADTTWMLVTASLPWERDVASIVAERYGIHSPQHSLVAAAGRRGVRTAVVWSEAWADLTRGVPGVIVERAGRFMAAEPDGDGGVLVGEPVVEGEAHYFFCTHGAHDPCCGRWGRDAMKAALGVPEVVSRVHHISHVGGDRFAGNLLVFPSGHLFGRLDRKSAPGVVARFEAGVLAAECYRGRTGTSLVEQAAIHGARDQLDNWDVSASVHVSSLIDHGDHLVATVAVDGHELAITLSEVTLDASHLRCDAPREKATTTWVALPHPPLMPRRADEPGRGDG